jgi:hypothetical protein
MVLLIKLHKVWLDKLLQDKLLVLLLTSLNLKKWQEEHFCLPDHQAPGKPPLHSPLLNN